VNEQQAYLAIRNAIRLENLSVETAAKIAPELARIFGWVTEQLRRLPAASLERELAYRQMQQQLASIFRPTNDHFYSELRGMLDGEVYRQMVYAQDFLKVAEVTPARNAIAELPKDGIGVSLDGKAFTGFEFTRTQMTALARETEVLGVSLERLFGADGEQSAWIKDNVKLIDQTVKRGFLLGNTNEQIAAELPGAGRVARARNKAIARTAVMDMSANAQEAFWDANKSVIAGWEFDASMDNRVCPLCAPWDGRTAVKREALPATPVHVSCRCRVLPLTETELLLRKEQGPQRRSVIELIEADSKEAAIAKARLAPNVVGARAYANQVKVNGKRYWRVAKDIQQPDHPLTMGEFLKQASPATQAQVLGSNKARGQFMRLVIGTKDTPPLTPDEALRRVTDFKQQDGPARSRSASALQPPRVRKIPQQKRSLS
jgi:SPP1 gp7 family putative phage head morphogenesis protein